MNAAAQTTWELKLSEMVSGPLKKVSDFLNSAQNKLNNFDNGLRKAANSSNVAGRDFKRNFNQLGNLLDDLKKRQEQAFNTKHIVAYQKMIDKTRVEMEKLNRASQSHKSKFTNFKEGLGNAAYQIPGIGGMMPLLTNPYTAVAAGVIATGKGLYEAAQMSKEWQKGMAGINATAQLSKKELAELSAELKGMGATSATELMRIPASYEKIVSSVGHGALSKEIMRQSLLAADATNTDLDLITGSMSKIMSSVGNKRSPEQMINALIGGKREGAGEFSDFAQYIPQLISQSQLFNMKPEDVIGTFSYMTGKQSAGDSAMLMQNVFSALSKQDVRGSLQKQGIKLFDEKGELLRFDKLMGQIGAKFNSLNTSGRLNLLNTLNLNDAQAKTGFATLMADSAKLTQSLDATNNAMSYTSGNFAGIVGELKIALAIMERDNPTLGLSRELNYFKSLLLSVGDSVLPVILKGVSGVLGFVRGMVESFKRFYAQSELVRDIFSFIKVTIGLVSAGWSFIFEGIQWAWSNIIKPIILHISNAYNMLKGFLGLKDIKAVVDVKTTKDEKVDPFKAGKEIIEGKGLPGDGSKTEGLSSGTSGSGIRSLTMNLTMHNKFEGSDSTNISKIHRLIKDSIVDAGRDALVTIGV